MSRYKFRVYDKEDKKYVTVCFENEEDRYNKGQAMIRHSTDSGLWFTLSGYRDNDGNHYQLDCEIEQCTGIPDKKGKAIYEGDRCIITRPAVIAFVEIEYKNGCFWGHETEHGTMYPLHNLQIDGNEIEVIGTIHDKESA